MDPLPKTATAAQVEAVRPPAEVLLTAEIQAVEHQIDKLLQREGEFRSMMINTELERLKLEAVSRDYQAALRLLRYGL